MTSKYISNLIYEIYKQKPNRFPIQIKGNASFRVKATSLYFFKNESLPKQQQNYSEEIHQLPFLNLNSLINHKNFQNFLE